MTNDIIQTCDFMLFFVEFNLHQPQTNKNQQQRLHFATELGKRHNWRPCPILIAEKPICNGRVFSPQFVMIHSVFLFCLTTKILKSNKKNEKTKKNKKTCNNFCTMNNFLLLQQHNIKSSEQSQRSLCFGIGTLSRSLSRFRRASGFCRFLSFHIVFFFFSSNCLQ